MRGHEAAKRALTVAIAGDHSVVLLGPTGAGKTLLLRCANQVRKELNSFVADPIEAYEVNTDPFPETFSEGEDRTSIHVECPQVSIRDLLSKRPGTDSTAIIERVKRAKAFAERDPQSLALSDECELLLKQAYEELGLNPRGLFAIIGVARTIANLDESQAIEVQHIVEAVQYQLLNRSYFGEKSRGNAHLKAAAPDLQDALQLAIQDAERSSKDLPDWYKIAVAAVKKSKGK